MPSGSPLKKIRAEIATIRASLGSAKEGVEARNVRLVAVSKTRTVEEIRKLISEGQKDFGENRVQEAREKWPQLLQESPDLRLRLIGPLQTNKVKFLPGLFHAVDSVDRLGLAEALARIADQKAYRPECLIQVNTGEEEQKSGILPKDLETFLRQCQDLSLNVRGLMCIPPIDEAACIHFAFLKKLCRQYALPECSMGMSGDYLEAISFGATQIRIGSALFGARTV